MQSSSPLTFDRNRLPPSSWSQSKQHEEEGQLVPKKVAETSPLCPKRMQKAFFAGFS
jgi:hypothetical protein